MISMKEDRHPYAVAWVLILIAAAASRRLTLTLR